jgi:SAM-dependent methyltransferase
LRQRKADVLRETILERCGVMLCMNQLRSPVAEAYDALADHYDLLTDRYDHERWWRALEALLQRHGLRGSRVLDAACGTGRSLEPLLGRGYEAVGCDVSAGMLGHARARLGPEVALHVADLRSLPDLGLFDLITVLDDAMNYLLGEDDLNAALGSLARLLAPGGLLLFDTNTLATYRGAFSSAQVAADEDTLLCWRGHGISHDDDATYAAVTVEAFTRVDGELWRRRPSHHRQRHWSTAQLEAALAAAGLELREHVGQRTGAVLGGSPDELTHTKVVHVAALAS